MPSAEANIQDLFLLHLYLSQTTCQDHLQYLRKRTLVLQHQGQVVKLIFSLRAPGKKEHADNRVLSCLLEQSVLTSSYTTQGHVTKTKPSFTVFPKPFQDYCLSSSSHALSLSSYELAGDLIKSIFCRSSLITISAYLYHQTPFSIM